MNTHVSSRLVGPLLQTDEDKWVLYLVVSGLVLIATAWPEGLGLFRYDRTGLENGEIWRVASANLVHLNAYHMFVNLFGLAMICELQWGTLPLRHGFGLIGFSGVAITLALWWLYPELEWYAGLSGALHGLWAGCAFYGLLSAPNSRPRSGVAWLDIIRTRPIYLSGLILIATKLLLENHYGSPRNMEQLTGGHVVTEAHLYGALAGVIYVLFWCGRELKSCES